MKLPKQLQNKEFRFIKVANGSKMAIEKNWAKTANYPYDDKSFLSYLSNAKNYGVLCGRGNLAIIDCDTQELAETVRLKLPNTFTVKTGSGNYHFYYIVKDLDKKIVFVDKDDKHHGELQWTGFQCVGPGSLHKSGARYKPVSDKDIEEISKTQLVEALDNYIQAKDKDTKKQEKFVTNAPENSLNWDIGKLVNDMNARLGDMSEKPLHENRDGELCGCHPVHGSTGKQNFHVNLEKGTWHCKRHNVGGDTLDLIAILEGITTCEDYENGYRPLKNNPKIFKQIKQLGISKYGYKDTTKHNYPEYREPQPITKSGLNTVLISRWVQSQIKFYFIRSKVNKLNAYVYENGKYCLDAGGTKIVSFVREYFEKHDCYKAGNVNAVVTHLKQTASLYINIEQMLSPKPGLINFNNGILDINTGKLLPHSPKYLFLYKIPHDYKENGAFCPKILKYLNETLDPDMITFTQELFGYSLYTGMPFPIIVYLYGTGGNGKSVWTGLLKALLGAENTTAKTLHTLSENRFATAQLVGRLANIASEINKRELKDTTFLKSLSSGDAVQAEYKGVDGFDFCNYAKMIFATNEIPYTSDKTDGWYQRQYIIPFLKKFRRARTEEVSLLKRLTSDKKEMAGLTRWAIAGLRRLLKNRGFSYSFEVQKRSYLNTVFNAEQFIEDRIEKTNEIKDIVSFKEIYDAYVDWTKRWRIPEIATRVSFGKLLYNRKGTTTDTKNDVNGKAITVIRYCKLKAPLGDAEWSEK